MQKSFQNIFFPLLAAIAILFTVSSCRVVKNLPEGQSLLRKNKVVVISKTERGRIQGDLLRVAAQKPNRRFIGIFPIKMWLYYRATRPKKLTKFRQWIIDKVGEKPVVYDSTQIDKSINGMTQYLANIGYLHARVTDTVIIKNRRAKVIYTVDSKELWKISEVELPKGHTVADSLVRQARLQSYLKKGDRFDAGRLRMERERIESVLRNSGFYYFNREYVFFPIDTTAGNNTMKIVIRLSRNVDETVYKQYKVNNIYIYPDYTAETFGDTLRRDTIVEGEFRFIAGKMKFHKKVLRDGIFFKKGDLYSKDAEISTIRRFSQLGGFKFISVEFRNTSDTTGDYLDGVVQLTPAKRNAIGWGAEANVTTEGLFGTLASINYKNKNLTKASDQLLLDLSGGVQLKFDKDPRVQVITGNVNANATYYLNKLLVPFRTGLKVRNSNPRTRINLGYAFEHRFDFDTSGNVVFLYQLHNFNFTFGYEWTPTATIQHSLNPLGITFYLLPITGDEFKRRLNLIPILRSSYEEQIIIGPSYTFNYASRNGSTKLRIMLETAGNLLGAGFKLANLNTGNDSLFLIAGRPFSQYFRTEVDLRNYIPVTRHAQFAIRTYAGVGVPYGNSIAMPFIKQFFVGGPNSLRGFLIREIGPGGYADNAVYDSETGKKTAVSFFNQTGDIKLETNAELRFDIYRWIKGAVFADAGNVWTIRKDTRVNGNFDFKRFWSEFAVDAGLGLRLDFSFFLIRFDYGFPLRDPRRVPGKRWQFQDGQAFKIGQFQLAINMPF